MAGRPIEPAPLPIARQTIFDPPPSLLSRPAIGALRFADGHIGWLVTDLDLGRQLLNDQRFSANNDLRRQPLRRPFLDEGPIRRLVKGAFIAMDPPEHTRYRRILGGLFSARRMKELEPRITAIVDQCLHGMVAVGPPCDLVSSFALPVPSLVICELLGVPYAERERFELYSAMLFRLDATVEQSRGAVESLVEFLLELVASKKDQPDNAIVSGLIAAGDLTDQEVAGVAFQLLVAGHETTANMIALGVLALLANPDQMRDVRENPALTQDAVEELLRYLTIIQFGSVRAALEDVELGGQLIKAGDSVCVSLPAANRDPGKFDDPNEFNVRRSAVGHIAFGFGPHHCIGHQLARVEMRICYEKILRHLPDLRLAVPIGEVPLRKDMTIYGVHKLPVTWGSLS